jgi:hypothetical protein
MNLNSKALIKIVVPVAIMVQLTAIIFLLSKDEDKAFNCKMYARGMIACREIKL